MPRLIIEASYHKLFIRTARPLDAPPKPQQLVSREISDVAMSYATSTGERPPLMQRFVTSPATPTTLSTMPVNESLNQQVGGAAPEEIADQAGIGNQA